MLLVNVQQKFWKLPVPCLTGAPTLSIPGGPGLAPSRESGEATGAAVKKKPAEAGFFLLP